MNKWILIIVLISCIPVQAQVEFTSFQDVMDYADDHAIAIQSAVISEQIALEEKQEAGAYLLPSVSSSFSYNDNITLQPTLIPAQILDPTAPEGNFEELTFGTKFRYTQGLEINWDVLNFQKLFALRTAKVRMEESQLDTDFNRYNTYNTLASTYYSILLTQESIEIYRENLKVSTSIFELARDKYRKGIIGEAELNRSEINMLQNTKTYEQALYNLDQFYLQLQSQLNTASPISISDMPGNLILDNNAQFSVHPEVVLQEAEVKKYEALLKQQKALGLPSLSLFYNRNRSWASDDFLDFGNSIELPQEYFGVQLSLSIFNPAKRPQVKQSKTQLYFQEIQLENIKLVKEQEDDLLKLQLTQAEDQLDQSKQILELQQKNDVHAENQYQSGILSLDSRLDKYDDLLVAQDNYLQSLAEFTLAQYKIYIRQINF